MLRSSGIQTALSVPPGIVDTDLYLSDPDPVFFNSRIRTRICLSVAESSYVTCNSFFTVALTRMLLSAGMTALHTGRKIGSRLLGHTVFGRYLVSGKYLINK